ncbi:MAG: DUF1538 domain-containing protein [Dongiaceae bacterium]
MDAGEPIKRARFGDFQREAALRQRQVSYNELTPSAAQIEAGQSAQSKPGRLRLRKIDVYRLLAPYVSVRFWAQVRAVVPLAVYLALFQLVVLRQQVDDSFAILAGLLAVILGLMLFMEGLGLGVMPFAEAIGNRLPKRQRLPVVLVVAFILGVGATFAEPAIGALQAAGSIVDVARAPYLHLLLNQWSDTLVLVVGAGVGIAAVLGTIRFIYGWSLKPLIFLVLVPTLALTAYFMTDEQLTTTIGVAWDSGAVTTGPITVPLVLALGIGIAAAAGKSESSLSGFGIVTLASLFPVLGVMLLTLWVSTTQSPEAIVSAATAVSAETSTPTWMEGSPGSEIVAGLRAILPLIAFLYLVMRVLLRERLSQGGVVAYGITLALLGMIVFNLGLTFGLSSLGGQSGSMVPAAFTYLETVFGSPLYPYIVGIGVALLFAWLLGFGATLAEPALNALGTTVESLTNGAFRKRSLMYAVSIGVAFGLVLGVAKIAFELPLGGLLLPLYAIAMLMTIFSSEEFVNIAWDSAGVTTGPVTVPLVLAMGLGFGDAMQVTEGFGILAMASICPIIAVQAFGLALKIKSARRTRQEPSVAEANEKP